MLSYKQIKRENHIIETLTVEHEKFELYESNELGNDELKLTERQNGMVVI